LTQNKQLIALLCYRSATHLTAFLLDKSEIALLCFVLQHIVPILQSD